jgi:hypothetical protein
VVISPRFYNVDLPKSRPHAIYIVNWHYLCYGPELIPLRNLYFDLNLPVFYTSSKFRVNPSRFR